jgi:hypothetical protein
MSERGVNGEAVVNHSKQQQQEDICLYSYDNATKLY